MRFLLPTVALFFLGFLGFSHADLRFASSPDNRFAVRNRGGSVAFSTTLALYMEPSTFGYQGLVNQKNNNYDNFLRSNIDNEQDNRNFNTEAGKDHLPFRTLETKALDATNQIPPSVSLTVEPGKEYVLPLRWNNPHASEMELNIWINSNTIVVPIKKPVCAGEGYQDGVISFIVPGDFNSLGSKVQGFNGCTQPGDCVLQMYAHSVEPRTYAAGTPIIITGWDPSKPKATDNSAVQPASVDPGTDLSKQPNEVCLPSVDPTSNIASAVPRIARQVSDVYNHAYQNSDYSPYSGQQQEAISKNMQAAGVLRMVNGNRGELGKSILTQDAKNTLNNLRNTADNIVKNYETLTNKIINQVLKNGAKSTATVAGVQKLNNCFRCTNTASVSNNRQETNTYVPSFKIDNAGQLQQARQIIAQTQNNKYANLINANGVLQIYVQALNDMAPAYKQLQQKYGLTYQAAQEKPVGTTATFADVTGFRKVDANGNKDGGKYAATKAKEAKAAAAAAAGATTKSGSDDWGFNSIDGAEGDSILLSLASGGDFLSGINIEVFSLEGSNLQANVDDDPSRQNNYDDREDRVENLPIKASETALVDQPSSGSSSSGSSEGGMSKGALAGIAAAGGAAFVGLIGAAIIIKNKKQQNALSTNNRVFTEAKV